MPTSNPGGYTLVIGYGNLLRGDDAVGQLVAEAVAGWRMRGVQALALHQLTPELAESLARARAVIFVDAYSTLEGEGVRIQPLAQTAGSGAMGHTGDPLTLLALAQAAFGGQPPAWWVLVPGQQFELGAPLSPATRAGMAFALRWICDRVGRTVAAEEVEPCTRSGS